MAEVYPISDNSYEIRLDDDELSTMCYYCRNRHIRPQDFLHDLFNTDMHLLTALKGLTRNVNTPVEPYGGR